MLFMAKRKVVKKASSKRSAERRRASAKSYQSDEQKNASGSEISEPAIAFRNPTEIRSFTVTRAGKQKDYSVHTGYGYFIPSFRKAGNLVHVNALVEAGLPAKEVEAIIGYLELKIPDIAKAVAVSTSTVSRWKPDTSIGLSGSNQFFRIDEVIRKGVEVFGSPAAFKGWLFSSNLALGNITPVKLITSHIGIEMIDEALDALHYGNMM
jgi:putative toxin-antitoxin system antitoxin component (TIGR02293 family)